jgi:hypothetical protein
MSIVKGKRGKRVPWAGERRGEGVLVSEGG